MSALPQQLPWRRIGARAIDAAMLNRPMYNVMSSSSAGALTWQLYQDQNGSISVDRMVGYVNLRFVSHPVMQELTLQMNVYHANTLRRTKPTISMKQWNGKIKLSCIMTRCDHVLGGHWKENSWSSSLLTKWFSMTKDASQNNIWLAYK